MGFFDSLTQGIGGILNSPAFGSFATGAGQSLVNNLFGNNNGGGPFGQQVQQFQPQPFQAQQVFSQPQIPPGFAPIPAGVNPFRQPQPLSVLPGGAMVPTLPAAGGFQLAGFDIPGVDLVNPFAPQGTGPSIQAIQQGGGAMSSLPFRPTMAGARASTFVVPNPVTGAPTWFKPAGRPILWSGDLSACKRVTKVARRARRARPR